MVAKKSHNLRVASTIWSSNNLETTNENTKEKIPTKMPRKTSIAPKYRINAKDTKAPRRPIIIALMMK